MEEVISDIVDVTAAQVTADVISELTSSPAVLPEASHVVPSESKSEVLLIPCQTGSDLSPETEPTQSTDEPTQITVEQVTSQDSIDTSQSTSLTTYEKTEPVNDNGYQSSEPDEVVEIEDFGSSEAKILESMETAPAESVSRADSGLETQTGSQTGLVSGSSSGAIRDSSKKRYNVPNVFQV